MNPLKRFFHLLIFIFLVYTTTQPCYSQLNLSNRIDSLLASENQKEFNGVILISKNGKVQYSKSHGFSDLENNQTLKLNDQFILASISKQITAVLVLQEFDKGKLQLNDPISKYLPELKLSWADSVTIHHLLNHTSGIVALDQPLAFIPGEKFSYSPVITYQLLGNIISKTSGKKYDELAMSLFSKCKMKNSVTAGLYKKGALVKIYCEYEGKLKKQSIDLTELGSIAPGAGIISTAQDLKLWNDNLHNGILISNHSYELMTKGSAIRNHPVLGVVDYGYGIQMTNNSLLEIGHAGYFEGINSINYYFPNNKTSVIVLSNCDLHPEDINKTFYVLVKIKEIVREELLKKK
jgi:CubicO group peptidase (beta-lactamase class C family)